MSKEYDIIEAWLKDVIIGLNLCPFAKRPFDNAEIQISLIDEFDPQNMSEFFLDELQNLHDNASITTSLICYPKCTYDFLEFNDFVGHIEFLLEELNLQDEYQVVTFHPGFYFDGLDKDDRSNFVNRSPYPLIHLLNTHDIEIALSTPNDGEKISLNNEKTLKNLSEDQFKSFFPIYYN